MPLENSDGLRSQVREVYSAAAGNPDGKHPFPVGRRFAASVGYPPDLLDTLPPAAVDAFCGVSNVAVFAGIPEGATVLDLGCGAGLDTLIAARRAGPCGKVFAIDFSDTMLDRARQAAAACQAANIEFRQADAEALPLEDASVDVALVNGIFNLNPARDAIFHELARVIRPGGELYGAEIIVRDLPRFLKPVAGLAKKSKRSPADWFA